MSDNAIKSVLQINGDINENDNSAPDLYPRELYITKDGRLLIGNPKSSKQDEPGSSYGTITVDKAINSAGIQYEPEGTNYKLSTDNVPTMQGFRIKDLVCSGQSGTVALTVGDGALDITTEGALRVYLGSYGRVERGTIKDSRLENTVVNLKSTQYGTALPTGTDLSNYRPGDIFILIQGS